MAIEKDVVKLKTGWLEFDARWLASLFGLKATGEARVVLSKIQVGIEAADIESGEVLEGHFVPAIVPTGARPKGRGSAKA